MAPFVPLPVGLDRRWVVGNQMPQRSPPDLSLSARFLLRDWWAAWTAPLLRGSGDTLHLSKLVRRCSFELFLSLVHVTIIVDLQCPKYITRFIIICCILNKVPYYIS